MHVLLVFVVLTASGNPDPQQLASDAISVTLEYSKQTGHSRAHRWNEWSYWDIVFDRREIRSIADLLSKAKPYKGDKLVLNISSYPGHLWTSKSRYSLFVDDQKIAPRSVVFTLRPVDEPGRQFAYRLAGRDAERFLSILWTSLREKSKHQKPTRVERIPIPHSEDPFTNPLAPADSSVEVKLAGFASPREAWDAYRHARHEGRWKDAYRCLTPESHERFVELIVYLGVYLEGTEDKDTSRQLKAILKSHRLDVDRIYEETKALSPDEYVKELNRRVKDREGLFREAMTLMARVLPWPKGKDGQPLLQYGAVAKVAISGDKATGQFMVRLDDGEVSEVDGVRQTERREQVRFRKINGRWFCVMSEAY